MKTNKTKLVAQSLMGKVHHPLGRDYRVDATGKAHVIPGTGGICYNVKVGDSAFGWVGDHIEPGVSIRNEVSGENDALITFACIGNQAKIVGGDAAGATGYVTGMHGGIEHTLVHFDEQTLEKLAIDDKIMIKGWGQGLQIEDFDDVYCCSIDPDLVEKMNITVENGRLIVPVVTEVPAYMMGSGIGARHGATGDYDIMTQDMESVKRHQVDKLRFGDFVLIKDHDNTYGRGYLKGSVSIGVVVHSDCIKIGHGPGIVTIFSSKTERIAGRKDSEANLKNYMEK